MSREAAGTPGRWRRRIWALTAAAVALRLILLLGRGHYVAFDEGWYLLLGRSLWAGEGYRLTGLRHLVLSPLFPILAGGAGRLLDDPVWGGRIVAAVASGLLVVPCWSVFRRLAPERVAFLGSVLVATAPSLAPFVAPWWIGWDLWVGAEPLAHLLLYGGIALFLRARSRRGLLAWLGVGALFALGYLARPEVLLPFGILGLVTAVLAAARWLGELRRPRPLLAPLLMAAGFAVVALPYWIYLHDATGRWTLTGRGVRIRTPVVVGGDDARDGVTGRERPSAGEVIEGMLWRDVNEYVRRLYTLDASGTALASAYWGVKEHDAGDPPRPPPPEPDTALAGDTVAPEGEPAPSPERTAGPAPGEDEVPGVTAGEGEAEGRDAELPGGPVLYLRALAVGTPLYVWPFVLLGLLLPGERRPPEELLVGLPLALTSVLVAGLVAVDPRTQLFVVPLLLFYAARGVLRTGDLLEGPARARGVREGFVRAVLVGAVVVLFLGTHGRRLQLSLTLGSPHHVVGEANHRVGQVLREVVPADEAVMSWHPALALFARRDWRVLPLAGILDLVRYSRAVDTEYIVLSIFYPPRILEEEPADYLILRIPPSDEPPSRNLRIDLERRGEGWAVGVLRNAEAGEAGGS